MDESPWPLLMRARNEGWYEQLEVPLVEIAVREAAALPSQLWCTLNMSACTVFDDAVERLLSSHPERRWGIEVLERSGPIRDDLEFRERIKELGCELAQGYYFSAAVQAKKMSSTIAELEERLWFDAK